MKNIKSGLFFLAGLLVFCGQTFGGKNDGKGGGGLAVEDPATPPAGGEPDEEGMFSPHGGGLCRGFGGAQTPKGGQRRRPDSAEILKRRLYRNVESFGGDKDLVEAFNKARGDMVSLVVECAQQHDQMPEEAMGELGQKIYAFVQASAAYYQYFVDSAVPEKREACEKKRDAKARTYEGLKDLLLNQLWPCVKLIKDKCPELDDHLVHLQLFEFLWAHAVYGEAPGRSLKIFVFDDYLKPVIKAELMFNESLQIVMIGIKESGGQGSGDALQNRYKVVWNASPPAPGLEA